MHTLYTKIDFLFDQCQVFAASHEKNLPNLPIKRLQISVDRQDYLVNWDDTLGKCNVIIHALGSFENRSGFVFGMHPNIDTAAKRDIVGIDAKADGDYDRKPPFRQYARYWLAPDLNQSTPKVTINKSGTKKKLIEIIAEAYAELELREDIEAFDEMSADVTVPKTGMQIHGEYTIYGHFMFLKHLLRSAEKIRFYMEKESGMRAACLSVFVDDIKVKRVDAFYVKIKKEMTISQKNTAMAIARRELEDFRATSVGYADLKDDTLRSFMLEAKIAANEFFYSGKFKDKWYLYPSPHKNEPEKAVSWLTDTGVTPYDGPHLARLMLRASLFGIDRYFMQVRRCISLLERPISSSSASGARWYGYSPYNPVVISKILEIFRVYHNYIRATSDVKPRKLEKGEKKRKPGEANKTYSTPAMRLGRVKIGSAGLADRKFEVEDVLGFVPRYTGQPAFSLRF